MLSHQNISMSHVSHDLTWEKTLTAFGLLLQTMLLAYWERQQGISYIAVIIVGFCLGGIIFRVNIAKRFVQYIHMASLGGAGMALGTWIDWGFATPACLCCIYQSQQGIWAIWATTMFSCSVLCMLTWPALYRLLPKNFAHPIQPIANQFINYITRCIGMLIGMLVAAWLGSHVVRPLPHFKLFVGHSMMVLGMLIGCQLALYAQQTWRGLTTLNSPYDF